MRLAPGPSSESLHSIGRAQAVPGMTQACFGESEPEMTTQKRSTTDQLIEFL
jgi:hypothetical protein